MATGKCGKKIEKGTAVLVPMRGKPLEFFAKESAIVVEPREIISVVEYGDGTKGECPNSWIE